MPVFEFPLESYTAVRLTAPDEASARLALAAVLKALSETEYAIGEARRVEGEPEPKSAGGRPPSARARLPEMVSMRDGGSSVAAIGKALGVHRGSVYRALKGALVEGD